MSRAFVTGGRGGIGAAIAAAYPGEVTILDLPEFDVASREAWASLAGEFDAAFLNAGIGIGHPDLAELPDEEIERIVGANILGVVYGARECARRLMPNGGSIVATASLAGLIGMPYDPMYTATKHAVVGFVRGAAEGLEAHGIRINALCPGFTDTAIVVDELRGMLPVPLMAPSFVAEGALAALNDGETGRAWIVQPNRIEPYRFAGVPGPRQVPRARSWGEEPPASPHIWRTLGYRGVEQGDGRSVLEWDATPDFCFHDGAGGFIVHGGMVTTLLDTAMGGAMWSLLAENESFLTADLRSEFLRSARPGTLRAVGIVVQRNRRVAFCSAELFQDGELLASSRCTQIIRST